MAPNKSPSTIPTRSLRPRPGRPNKLVTEFPAIQEIIKQAELPASTRALKRKRAEITSNNDDENTDHKTKRSRSGEIPRVTILDLPMELIQQIGFSLPYASLAMPMMNTCRRFYEIMGSHFWFQRRRIFPRLFGSELKGIVKRDMTEAFSPKKDYRDIAIRSFHGWTGGYSPPNKKAAAVTDNEQTPKKKKKKRDDIMRCQLCIMRMASARRFNGRTALCPDCYHSNLVEKSTISFLRNIRLDRCRSVTEAAGYMRRYNITYYWIPDLEIQVMRCRYYNTTFDDLLHGADRRREAKRVANEAYRPQQKEKLMEFYREHWAQPKYDKFREAFTDLEEAYENVADYETAKIIATENERPKSWYQSKLLPIFQFFDAEDTETRMRYKRDEILRSAVKFHTARLNQQVPGEAQKTGFTHTIGICKLCYDEVATRKDAIDAAGLESLRMEHIPDYNITNDDHDGYWVYSPLGKTICEYMSPKEMALHYWYEHTAEFMSSENNEGGEWFQFMTEVEGAEPVRVAVGGERPEMPLPPSVVVLAPPVLVEEALIPQLGGVASAEWEF